MIKFGLLVAFLVAGVTCFPEERSTTKCNSFCPLYLITFCGTDGKTYISTNDCMVRSRMCSEGRNDYANFKMVHPGACSDQTTIAK